MKFDVVVGNPPYQDSNDNPIYYHFIDIAMKLSDAWTFIHPARFLFNAGATPKIWNKKMLNDPYLEVKMYEQNSAKLFPNTDIKGGVCITLWNNEKQAGLGGIFVHFKELKGILQKVINGYKFQNLSTQVFPQSKVNFEIDIKNPSERRIRQAYFAKFPEYFVKKCDDIHTIKIEGQDGSTSHKRVHRYMDQNT